MANVNIGFGDSACVVAGVLSVLKYRDDSKQIDELRAKMRACKNSVLTLDQIKSTGKDNKKVIVVHVPKIECGLLIIKQHRTVKYQVNVERPETTRSVQVVTIPGQREPVVSETSQTTIKTTQKDMWLKKTTEVGRYYVGGLFGDVSVKPDQKFRFTDEKINEMKSVETRFCYGYELNEIVKKLYGLDIGNVKYKKLKYEISYYSFKDKPFYLAGTSISGVIYYTDFTTNERHIGKLEYGEKMSDLACGRNTALFAGLVAAAVPIISRL